jgi:hypothetical protein
MNLRSFFEFTPQQRDWWQRTRTRGKYHYVVYRWVLGWGGFMFVFMTVFSYYLGYNRVFDSHSVIIGLIVWPLAGLGAGLWTWHWNEKKMQDFEPAQNKPLPLE